MFLTGFGSVNVSAATNLINPNLNEWDNITSSMPNDPSVEGSLKMSVHTINSSVGNIYRLQPTKLGTTGTTGTTKLYYAHMFDKTVLKAGNNYTFQMHILSPSEIRRYTSYTWDDSGFTVRLGHGYIIGFGVVDFNGEVTYIQEFVAITPDNYSSLAGKDFVQSFECPSYSGGNPCIFIMSSWVDAESTFFFDDSIVLIDNAEEDEEGFLSGLFEWFEKKFNAIGESFANLGNKLSTGFSNLGDRIKTFFSDLGTSISNGLNSVKEGIQNKLEQVKTTLVELGESLINGIKGLFVPSEDYILTWKANLQQILQEHLGIIYTSGDLITGLLEKTFEIVFNAPDSYGLTIPDVTFELPDGTVVQLFHETDISFDFMENRVFKTMYGLYGIALYILFGSLEVKYALRVYRKVMAN